MTLCCLRILPACLSCQTTAMIGEPTTDWEPEDDVSVQSHRVRDTSLTVRSSASSVQMDSSTVHALTNHSVSPLVSSRLPRVGGGGGVGRAGRAPRACAYQIDVVIMMIACIGEQSITGPQIGQTAATD
jgi:hypothetical protein